MSKFPVITSLRERKTYLVVDLYRLIDFLTSECLYAFDFSKGDKAADVIENVRRTSRDPAKELLDHLMNGTPLTMPLKAAPEPHVQKERSQTEEEKAAIEIIPEGAEPKDPEVVPD